MHVQNVCPFNTSSGIVIERTVWGFVTSQYPGIHDIGLPSISPCEQQWSLWKLARTGVAVEALMTSVRGMPTISSRVITLTKS